ncbi:hypothetical protein SUGI_0441450 [Cryptomeria japonica]|nr:hypothetical protein SUGI_0441450 [Cryptomeria japonica]
MASSTPRATPRFVGFEGGEGRRKNQQKRSSNGKFNSKGNPKRGVDCGDRTFGPKRPFHIAIVEIQENVNSFGASLIVGVITWIDNMTPDLELRDKVLDELEIYKSAKGRLFSSQLAINRRGKQQPDLWSERGREE